MKIKHLEILETLENAYREFPSFIDTINYCKELVIKENTEPVIWNDILLIPEEDRELVVMDTDGKEYDRHYWNGHRYYEYVGEDGYPSDVDIDCWRYK